MLKERNYCSRVDRKIYNTTVFTDGKLYVAHQNFVTETFQRQHREGENK